MLYTQDFENVVLYNPAQLDWLNCDHLQIVTGFADCDMISQHLIQLHDGQVGKGKIYSSKINIDIILGMYKGAGLTMRKHRNILQTLNRVNAIDSNHIHTSCRYIYRGDEVHSKVYAWSKNGEPLLSYVGSANYTVNAFRVRRETMCDCEPDEPVEYYNSLLNDSIDCFDKDVPKLLRLSDTNIPDEEISPDNYENLTYDNLIKRTPIDVLNVSWLSQNGRVGESSGPNWGIRSKDGYIDQHGIYVKYNRDRNQAYLPYNNRKVGFFPDRKNPHDKNCPLFKAVTKNDGIFYMRMAQDNNKALHTAESNAILGKWLRKCLRLPDGAPVTLADFKRYGRTYVTFYKYADDVFIMDF